jgi:hypothetical protein
VEKNVENSVSKTGALIAVRSDRAPKCSAPVEKKKKKEKKIFKTSIFTNTRLFKVPRFVTG